MTTRTYLLCHAHPDDETLATGAIALALRARGDGVAVLTATRGEQGEVRPGPYSALEGTPELGEIRHRELSAALTALGVTRHAYLGEPPARAAGASPRRYSDSGMRWLTPTLAGPRDDACPDALTAADEAEVAADIAACATAVGATDLVSYSDDGGYGHPDHIRMHRAAWTAAQALSLPFHVIVTDPEDAYDEWLDASAEREALDRAYDAYDTQLSRVGDDVTHVGGQPDRVIVAAGLRRA